MPWPDSVPKSAGSFDIDVFVTVEPDGSVQNVHVWKPSPYPDADTIAVEAATESVFEPAVGVDCKPVSSNGMYRFGFRQ